MDKKKPEKMIYIGEQSEITPEDLTILSNYMVQSAPFMATAVQTLDYKHFRPGETHFKLLYAIASEFYNKHKVLIPKEFLLSEIESRIKEHPVMGNNIFHTAIKERVEEAYAFTADELPLSFGLELIQKFRMQRVIAQKLRDIVERQAFTIHELEGLTKQVAEIENQGVAVDFNKHSAAAGLLDSCTFAPVKYYTTGYPSLDKVLGGGLAEGEMTSLAAAAGMAKSTLMVNMALRMAAAGIPVAVLSLEMRSKAIWQLAVAIDGRINRTSVRTGNMDSQQDAACQTSITKMMAYPIYVFDRSSFAIDPDHPEAPTMAIVSRLIENAAAEGVKTILIDYLTKIGPFDDDELSRYPRLTNWAFGIAQRTNVHLVCLMQSNKAGLRTKNEEGEGSLNLQDVKGPIEMIADCDNVVGLARSDYNTEVQDDFPELRVIAKKVRSGPGGIVSLHFDKSTGRIDEYPPVILNNTYLADKFLSNPQATTPYMPPVPHDGKPLKSTLPAHMGPVDF